MRVQRWIALILTEVLCASWSPQGCLTFAHNGSDRGGGDYEIRWSELLPERVKIISDFDFRGRPQAPAVQKRSTLFRDQLLVADSIHVEQNLRFDPVAGIYTLGTVLATAVIRDLGTSIKIETAVDRASGELYLARYGISTEFSDYFTTDGESFAPVTWFASVLQPERTRVLFNVGDLPVPAERMPRDWLSYNRWTHHLLLAQSAFISDEQVKRARTSLTQLETAIESLCRPIPLVCGLKAFSSPRIVTERVERILAEQLKSESRSPSIKEVADATAFEDRLRKDLREEDLDGFVGDLRAGLAKRSEWSGIAASFQHDYLRALQRRLENHLRNSGNSQWTPYFVQQVALGPWTPEWVGVLGRAAPAAVDLEQRKIAIDLNQLSALEAEIFLFHELSHLLQAPAPSSARSSELFAWRRTFEFVDHLRRQGLTSPLFDSLVYAKDSFGLDAWVDIVLRSRGDGSRR